MSEAIVGRLTAAAILVGAAAGSGAELSRLVNARVVAAWAGKAVRYEISVTSKDPSRRVVSVLAGQLPGILEEPKSVTAPNGWHSQVRRREGRAGLRWAVQFACIESDSPTAGAVSEQSAQAAECGLRAGETVKFDVILQYRSASLETAPVFIDFSDGRTGIASR